MKMNMRSMIAGMIALLLMAGATARAGDAMMRFDSRPGSKMRIEGTSSVHDWQMEGKLIGGYFEAGGNFPSEPGQSAQPGKIDAHAEIFVPVRSLQSLEKDGKPYSTHMDDRAYEAMNEPTNKKILFHLTELVLKEAAK